MTVDVRTLLTSGAALTDQALERLLPPVDTVPHSIHRAMRHSVFAGGKRLRPVLCIEAARMVASTRSEPLPHGSMPELSKLAAALEMIHTYSLIHDDLPALDNDDLRRGQPTCHVIYGEAIAILAGDALQTLAFHTVARLKASPKAVVAILTELTAAIATGVGHLGELDTGQPPGMIGGQVLDVESEGTLPSASLVEAIHRSKTGALIAGSLLAGAIYGAPEQGLSGDDDRRLRCFGEKTGLAFQIVDDILDVTEESAQLGKTAGKDQATQKATWPGVVGLERALQDASELVDEAFDALEPFGPAADALKALARYLIARKN